MNEDWSWTNKLWVIAYEDDEGSKDEYLIRAVNEHEALRIYLEERAQDIAEYKEYETIGDAWADAYSELQYIFGLPTHHGITKLLNWRCGDGAREYDAPAIPPCPARLLRQVKEDQ